MAIGGHYKWCQKMMFRSREILGLFTGNEEGHSKHILTFSALYYFFHFKN